ncbi:peptide ABC transporter substrate-binding protein [Marinobacterium aestuarii]|uniref:Peptide ABC transporter substrate-binding protein n=1 Tax=Marinobacterium aestuarii TaxID=1821621 RepID=A0A1A9F3B7_9GAMM|nr:peptide ABC transporter substrate-binding protein [Marinobacterium aestuarii]
MRHVFKTIIGASLLSAAVSSAYAAGEHDVRIVLNEELDVVEPCMAARSNVGRVILQNVNETLTEFDAQQGGLKPRLATAWEQVNESTWRFKLREGVKFHNGEALDANDVKFSLERTADKSMICEVGVKYFGGTEMTINVIDDQTLEVMTSPAQPILPLLFSTVPIVPDSTPRNEFTRAPVGTGPYSFAQWNVGQNIVLERNGNYWGEQPVVDTATYLFRSDSAVAAAMVQTGEADIVPNIAVQDATNKDTDFSYPNSETARLRIDVQISPLDDRRVREALNLAIDRQALRGSILSADVIPATQLVVPTTSGYNKDLQVWPYDPERARALLAAAKADGVPVDAEIKMIGRTNVYPNATEVMEALMAMLQDAGFNASLQMYDVAEWNGLFIKPFPENRGPTLLQAQHDNAKGDAVFTAYGKYHSQGGQSVLDSVRVDALIGEATAASGDNRTSLWQQLFAEVNDTIIADIPLFHMVGYTRVNPRLSFKPTIATNSELQLSQISFK